jgi:hypothetical protein
LCGRNWLFAVGFSCAPESMKWPRIGAKSTRNEKALNCLLDEYERQQMDR